MNKKIFIFLFLIASSPVWAAEDVVKEEVVIEKEPQLENIQYNPAKGETTFMQKIKTKCCACCWWSAFFISKRS